MVRVYEKRGPSGPAHMMVEIRFRWPAPPEAGPGAPLGGWYRARIKPPAHECRTPKQVKGWGQRRMAEILAAGPGVAEASADPPPLPTEAPVAAQPPAPPPPAPSPAAVPTLAEFAPRWLEGHCAALQQKRAGVAAKRYTLGLVFPRLLRPNRAMRDETDAHHERIVALGRAMGFEAVREWSPPVLGGEYVPRIDVLWSWPLTRLQRQALETMGATVPHGALLPIAAWEIEGSDASTKGMAADLANLRVTRAPFGFLAARGGTKDNLYERALYVARTQRHYFGCQAAVPLDANWIANLAKLPITTERHAPASKVARGGGGEASWAESVRRTLRERGTKAGFGVTDSFKSLLSSKDGFTRHEIDVVWTLPMPRGLRQLVEAIAALDDRLVRGHLILGERYDHVAVAGFEIENSGSKHGFGGLLTLAAHGVNGVFVAGDRVAATSAAAALATYRRFLGLPHVTVYDGLAR